MKYEELLEQRNKLSIQLDQSRREELKAIKDRVRYFNFTEDEVFPKEKPPEE